MTEVLLLVGTRKGLVLARSTGDRSGWQFDPLRFTMNAVYAVGVDTRRATPRLFAAADSEHWGPSLFHSDDLGATWVEPEQAPVRFPERTGAALARVWQVQPGPASQPDVVYAGTEPSAVFKSVDGGDSFTLVEGLWDHPHRKDWFPGFGGQAVHTIVPHPVDTERVTVAMSTGGVYRTTDGGASWSPTNKGISVRFMPDPEPEYGQCVHKVASHAGRPDRMFAQNHHGVYRSDDGGDSWREIETGLPSNFGFPIVVHPHKPDTVYLFPLTADGERMPPELACRVYRSDDAGESWRALSAGLQQEGYYSTVLRDAMCTDTAERAGVYFGSRNGELYASNDEGESWQTIARNLPDVLSVRAVTL
ncbi:MAG: exo-alpha-sialidase [Streptosporangiales bacterium]|nr:exo-alpha-sialidase [Streptosporangiales bacterium]